jgi:hypothetical protein
MKRVILLGALAMVVLASCKKEYTCECCDIYGDCYLETKRGSDAQDACEVDLSDALAGEYCDPV